MAYHPSEIEPKWQAFWEKNQTFKTETTSSKPKYYVLDMFPYPSSSGLHVGHPEGYTATDIMARYKRAKGFNVLHPMGWDAFGLPAEQYAIKTGVHPAITTNQAIENFRRQLKMLGFSYDWSREIATCDPKYYRWTQWIFLRLYERGLAYQTEVPVNWCPELKTVLANEEVVDGKSERGGHPVYRIPMKQWMLKITAYAERLLEDLNALDWPEGTKELQRNWIGKSVGLQMKFKVDGTNDAFEIFTTRPDTLWGVSYMALAPEHPLVGTITTPAQKAAVKKYQEEASQKSEVARQDASKEKTGCFTGAYAINPVNGEKVPIWIADYVMMSYGTGAVMAVPAHDERDFEFAKKFQLPIKIVVAPVSGGGNEDECFSDDGVAVNSGFINGLKTKEATAKVIDWAENEKIGTKTVKYKLRDWLFSRQRYWGEPFPIKKDANGKIIPLKDDELPVTLPDVQSYEPTGTGESPLAGNTPEIRQWREIKDEKTGEVYLRETDTMPGSAGSSWYFLRYCDPHNDQAPVSKEAEKYWMPVDLYLGGDEHAVGHLLYSRFWMKVLFDAGVVSHSEPFQKLIHQGMILGEDGEKMSKSRGNVINPDDVVKEYGADTLRIYEMFLGPLEKDKPWSTQAIEGIFRFLSRAERLMAKLADEAMAPDDEKILHQTIKKVTEDIEGMRFNTAISTMMVLVNHFTAKEKMPKSAMKPFTQILAPFAPHLCEEFWSTLGEKESLSYAAWPKYDPALVKVESVTLAIQVLGKLRATLDVPPGAPQAEVEAQAKALEAVQRFLEGKAIVKVIYVPNKILNFVVK